MTPFVRMSLRGLALSTLLATAGFAHAQEPTFRVRSDLGEPLNSNSGWAGAEGEEVTVEADRPFRLRMEIAPQGDDRTYALQVRRNGGPWELVEAHDFPYPKRELEISFDGQAPGSVPAGWSARSSQADALRVIGGESGPLMRASGQGKGLLALYAAPWSLPQFKFGTRFRQVSESGGFALVFGHDEAGDDYRVHFARDGHIRVARLAGGQQTTLAERSAPFLLDGWHEAEIEVEDEKLTVDLDGGAFEFSMPIQDVAHRGDPGIALTPDATVDFAEFVLEGEPRTPRVSIVADSAYANGDRTSDLLNGSAARFAPAFGLSLTENTPRWSGEGKHGEFEWPLVIRRFAEGAVLNETGDRFEFRMVDSTGAPMAGGPLASVVLRVPPGHLGGTFVETPGRIGPWQASNGDLYFIMEPAESDNKFMVVKSSDGGRSWREVDGENRPRTGDLESVDSRLVGDRIHIIHQVTRSVRYHVFRTSDHPTHPDSWEIHDEVAVTADAVAQTASMAMRSDGSVPLFFLADRLHYVIRGVDGAWSQPIEIDPEEKFINTGPQAVVGRDDVVHLAYFSDDGSIWYRRLLPDNTLTPRQKLAQGAGAGRPEYGAVLPLAYDAASDTVIIAYRLADGTLWERRVKGNSAPRAAVRISRIPVITDAVDSQQPAADLVTDSEATYALFVDEATRAIYSSRGNGRWGRPVIRVDGINGSWVRGNIIRKPDGTRVYGYVYDAGSGGGAGMNRYAEFPVGSE